MLDPFTKAKLKRQYTQELKRCNSGGWYKLMQDAASAHWVPIGLVLAVGSRETGLRNIEQFGGGGGRGIMQVDLNYHSIAKGDEWMRTGLIDYAVKLLRTNYEETRKFILANEYRATEDQRWKMACAAYNCGFSGMKKAYLTGDCDARTTGGDYGKDCIQRRNLFNEILNEKRWNK